MSSSVNVPVLSKTNVVILAARFTLLGEVQNICDFFSLKIAKSVPTAKQAGIAGGTVVVIMLRQQSIINHVVYPFEANKGT